MNEGVFPNAPRCTAKAKGTGRQCCNPAVTGFSVCRHHGAGSRKKPGGRPVAHGRYSKHLPERLAGKYAEAQADERLLELRDEIALLDARLGELLGNLDSGESGALWQTLKAAYADLQAATKAKDTYSMLIAIQAMGSLLDAGNAERLAWAEVVDLVDRRRRLVESERKRLVEMQQMISSERAMVLIAALVDIVRRHVDDRATLAAISADIRSLTAIDAG